MVNDAFVVSAVTPILDGMTQDVILTLEDDSRQELKLQMPLILLEATLVHLREQSTSGLAQLRVVTAGGAGRRAVSSMRSGPRSAEDIESGT